MPTDDAAKLAVIEETVKNLYELVNSGPSVPWDQSIRGRLHRVTQYIDSEDKLSEALRELKRERTKRWTRGQQALLVAFVAVSLATPYVLLFFHGSTH